MFYSSALGLGEIISAFSAYMNLHLLEVSCITSLAYELRLQINLRNAKIGT